MGECHWVAYSGGLDSTVLLHKLVQSRKEAAFDLRATHIHHGLNPKADEWQKHCEKICNEWGIELLVHKIDLSDSHENIEARARELRYHYFSTLLQVNDCLFTGHHQDDQAETVLLQLLRGAGPKGLSAMPPESQLGKGKLIRPLLNLSRDALLAYAQEHRLRWIDDDSNQNTRFTRNFIRHDILPLLKQRWPNATEAIARSAKHCAETEKILESYIAPLFEQTKNGDFLSIKRLKMLTPIEQKHVFRYWLSYHGFLVPNERKLENCLRSFLYAKADKHPFETWGNVILRRSRDDLIATRKK